MDYYDHIIIKCYFKGINTLILYQSDQQPINCFHSCKIRNAYELPVITKRNPFTT